jgi:Spy/CpxP family protein refolding chaperone
MDTTKKRKWQVRVAAAIIFLLGFTGGALSFNAYHRWSRNVQANGNPYEQMLDRLQLNSEQKAQVHQILGDARSQLQEVRKQSEPRVKEIRQQTDERLQKILTADQWKQFQEERDKMRARRRRGPKDENKD